MPRASSTESNELFIALVARADPANAKDMDGLSAALFNFRLPPASALTATAAVMAACNRRPAAHGYDGYANLVCPALPDGLQPVAAAAAVEMLGERGKAITDNFRGLAPSWFRGYENVPESVKEQVIAMIRAAWPPGNKEGESPLHRSFPSFARGKS